MKPITRKLLRIGAAVFVFGWLLLVWPTPWKYFKNGSTNLRVNRFSGNTETLGRNGWR